jgi:hypothetical protein
VNKNIFVLLLALFIVACGATKPEAQLILPKESITSMAPALAGDVVSNLDRYIKKEFNCDEWSIVNVRHGSADGQITFTKVGQIHAGKITETWQLNQCGVITDLGLAIAPDGKGGSLVAIAKL